MPHQTTLPPIGNPFIELATVDSTNNYAMAQVRKGVANHGTAYFAYDQTAGKGQRGKSWTTTAGENLILSVVIEPGCLNTLNTFALSAAIAAGCYDLFKSYAGDETLIKWPNDIYWRDRKAGGILIENVIQKDRWAYSIAGIGININQTAFNADLLNPVSLKQITGKSYNPVALAIQLCSLLQSSYQSLQLERGAILEKYNRCLYKLNQPVKLRKQNKVFETILKGVSPSGKLLTQDSMEHEFDFGEVQWVF